MTPSLIARLCAPASLRDWFVLGSSLFVALWMFLLGARPVHAQTIYHVDDDSDDGLIAYYKLEETYVGDTIAFDLVGGAHGTMNGGATFANTSPSPFLGQNFGYLDMPGGTGDQALITTPINFGSSFTVAAWVKRDQLDEFQTIFDAGTGLDNGHWYVAIGDSTPDKHNSIVFGRRGISETAGITPILDANWHHIAVSHSADNTVRIYLDGNLDRTVSGIVLSTLSGTQRIGAVSVDNGIAIDGNFDGSIDELRLYDRSLSLAEIQRLANGFGCVSNGTSWTTAFSDLQCALEVSVFGDTIHVAQGRYLPGIHPDAHFFFGPGDNVLGGFENGNVSVPRPPLILDYDNFADYLNSNRHTILTGDLLGNDPPDDLTAVGSVEEADNLRQVFRMTTAAVRSSLDGVMITGGRATTLTGGGGRVSGSPSIANVVFLYNRADYGGGLEVGLNSTPTLVNTRFVRNEATFFGGGIEIQGFTTFSGTGFISNTAGISGGGMGVREGGARLFIADFTRNQASQGGAIYTEVGVSMSELTLRANQAITDGAGIFLTRGASLTVTNGLFANNNSGGFGGGIYGESGSHFALTGGSLEENHARRSGGAIFALTATIVLSDVVVMHNSSDSSGGALAATNSLDSSLRGVDFIENSTGDDDGGAMRVRDGELQMDRVSFVGNAADQSGGALSVENGAIITASNLLMVGNIGNTGGGSSTNDSNAIRIEDDSQLHLINSTIAANSGAANSLFEIEDSATLTLSNTILWDNVPPSLSIEATSTLTAQNIITGSPISGVDPRLVRNPNPGDGDWATLDDNDYGDLNLRGDSPAIDQGDGTLLPADSDQDFGSNPRIFDANYATNAFASPIDLGAFEAHFVALIANAGGPYTGGEGQVIALDGSASSPDTDIIFYEWDCVNDGSFDTTSGRSTGQSCTYNDQGEFTLRLRVTDSEGITNTSTTTVTINNLAPAAQDDSITTDEDTAITINVLTNDSDVAADPLTITQVDTPANGSATIQENQVRYTPAADFNGSDSFSYTISDGDGGSATATVTVTVTPVDDPGDPEGATIHLPLLAKE